MCLTSWPVSVYSLVAIPGAVSRHEDRAFGMTRIEITCTACGGHLGHVFKGEGFNTPSMWTYHWIKEYRADLKYIADERHCVNSISLKFQDE